MQYIRPFRIQASLTGAKQPMCPWRTEGRKPVSKLGPRQTLITLPDEIRWQVPDGVPPESVAEAVLAGAEEQESSYLVLMKWFPGRMSAPHTYVTDRLCVVVSGVWWCNSGPDFDPGNAVPVYPGGFVLPGGTNAALRRGAARGNRSRGHRGDRNWPGQTGLVDPEQPPLRQL